MTDDSSIHPMEMRAMKRLAAAHEMSRIAKDFKPEVVDCACCSKYK